jgi:hypothetical protein
MMNEYDEIKKLLKRARLLQEQTEVNNIAKSIERSASDIESSSKDVDVDEVKKEKSKTYRISGGLITLHGKNEKDLLLTSDEKTAYQETMDDFVAEVSDLADFGVLNIYKNEVQWSGKLLEANVEFFFTVGETNGVYINGDMIKLDEKLTSLSNKLNGFFEKFKSKWAKVLGTRKKTRMEEKK